MKCAINHEDFARLLRALFPPGVDFDDPDFWPRGDLREHMVRAVARDGTFSARTEFGEATVPAQVERPGVIFVALWEFYDSGQWNLMQFPHRIFEIREDDGSIMTNDGAFMCDGRWARFDDPDTAPQRWEDVEFDEEDEDDWYGDDEDEDGEEGDGDENEESPDAPSAENQPTTRPD